MIEVFSHHLIRTFPHHDFFMDGQGIGQENLFNVLKAYSLCVATKPIHFGVDSIFV